MIRLAPSQPSFLINRAQPISETKPASIPQRAPNDLQSLIKFNHIMPSSTIKQEKIIVT